MGNILEAFRALRAAGGHRFDDIDVDRYMAFNRDDDYEDGDVECPECRRVVANYYWRCPECKAVFEQEVSDG